MRADRILDWFRVMAAGRSPGVAARDGGTPRYTRAGRGVLPALALLAGLTGLAGLASAGPVHAAEPLLIAPAAGVQAPAPPPAPAERTVLQRLEVVQGSGSFEQRAHLTFGVPLARGRVTDAADLRLWRTAGTAAGQALPVQARPLSRWPDDSLRWALIDTQVALQAHEKLALAVGLAPDIPADLDPWNLSAPDVDGPPVHMLSDGRTDWPLLSTGPDGDRVAGLSARLVDRFGLVWRGDLEPRDAWSHQGPRPTLAVGSGDGADFEVVERGPLRLTVRLRGVHRPSPETPEPTPAGDPPPADARPAEFHSFTVYVHFLAGTSTARIEWSLENGPLHDPPGALAFRSYELEIDPGAQGGREVDLPGSPERGDYAFELLQDGPGPARLVVEGRKLGNARPGDLFAGVRADDGRGVYLHRVASGPNHPNALGYTPDGPLVLSLLAEPGGRDHWLDDATRKTFRLTLAMDVGLEGRALMLAARRPSYVVLDPRDVAASGAWGDLGFLDLPGKGEWSQVRAGSSEAPTGWADYGEWVRNTHQSGSPRNRLSVYLEAVQSGSPELFAAATARAWHALDLRPYHILGFSADEFPKANLYEGLPHGNEPPERRLGRTGIHLRFPEYKDGLPHQGHGYNGFDPEHMTLDDVYECYLLTGSWQALSALRSAGEAMLTWQWVRDYLHTARTTGWTLRALVQVHRATDDDRYLDAARHMVDLLEAERGRGEVKYVHRNKPDKRHLEGEQSESPWMVAVAVHGLAAYGQRSGDERIPAILADLSELLLLGFRGNGFVSDLPVDRRASREQLRSEWGNVWQPTGTSQWIPGALAAAALITGDPTPVDRIYPYYVVMSEHSSRPTRFGASSWHWWQPYVVSLRSRHGDRAVTAPRSFDMPTPPLTPELLAP